jgi:hypothetical protein
VHCLAYLLLNLDVESEQEIGLNLLLVGSSVSLSQRSVTKLISAGGIKLCRRDKTEKIRSDAASFSESVAPRSTQTESDAIRLLHRRKAKQAYPTTGPLSLSDCLSKY